MTLALSFLAALLILAVLAAVLSEVRRQREARAYAVDALSLVAQANAAYQAGHVAGIVDAVQGFARDASWRVVVSERGRTLRASGPMPYAAALVIAGRAMAEVNEGGEVEVERT